MGERTEAEIKYFKIKRTYKINKQAASGVEERNNLIRKRDKHSHKLTNNLTKSQSDGNSVRKWQQNVREWNRCAIDLNICFIMFTYTYVYARCDVSAINDK